MESPRRRIYLTPKVVLEDERGTFYDERLLPGRQGRVAFAYLVLERLRPVPRDELASALWPEALPPSWETSLSAIGSKIRSVLAQWEPSASLESGMGCFQLRLPSGTWVDVDAALDCVHTAETLLANDPSAAHEYSDVAYKISPRPFLPGEDAPWIERVRRRQTDVFLRSAVVKSTVWTLHGDTTSAVMVAEAGLDIDPYREDLYRCLMQAHAAAGSRADAARAYKRCVTTLQEELGIAPSAETDAVFEAIRG
jgi:SARP family transcriptional regulator, regulator of embCAB operon